MKYMQTDKIGIIEAKLSVQRQHDRAKIIPLAFLFFLSRPVSNYVSPFAFITAIFPQRYAQQAMPSLAFSRKVRATT